MIEELQWLLGQQGPPITRTLAYLSNQLAVVRRLAHETSWQERAPAVRLPVCNIAGHSPTSLFAILPCNKSTTV